VSLKSTTLSVSIDCSPSEVARFVSNPRNLPQWAPQFCKAVRRSGDDWIIDTPNGPVTVYFVNRNDLGVLDHVVVMASGEEITVPMRVVANGTGSEVILTMFQLPGMSADQYAEDAAMVEKDLRTLRQVLESRE
jgi:hypothetical protein